MKLKPQELLEFKKLYKQKFGVELNDKETLDKALKLLNLVILITEKNNLINNYKRNDK